MDPGRKRQAKIPLVTVAAAAVLASILIRDALGAPLRFELEAFSLAPLWFAFDGALALILGVAVLLGLKSTSMRRKVMAFTSIGLVLVPALVGYVSGNGIVSLISGYKILAPLLLCLNAPLILNEITRRYHYPFLLLLILTFGFLWFNQFINYQWVGAELSQFGQKKDVSRLWFSAVGQRYAGATVASVSAAALLVFFYAIVREKYKALWIELALLAVAAYGIWLTDSKTTYIALALVFITGNLYRLPSGILKLLRAPLLVVQQRTLSVLFLIAGAVPLMLGILNEPVAYFRYNSLLDRIKFTWPSAIARIEELGGSIAYFTGTGFGSFGSPSYYSQKYVFVTSDCDNFLIYGLAIYGIGFIVLYYLLSRFILKAEGLSLVLFSAFGAAAFSTNCEMPEMLIMLGLAVSSVFYGRNVVQYLPWKSRFKVVF